MKLTEHLKQPLYTREQKTWYWPTGWYIIPKNLEEEDEKQYAQYCREIYPLQYFLRATVFPKLIDILTALRFFPTP
jgi:hypothetical protein